jgi:hypothetical protein
MCLLLSSVNSHVSGCMFHVCFDYIAVFFLLTFMW